MGEDEASDVLESLLQLVEHSFHSYELIEGALLDDLSSSEHCYLVCVSHCFKSMSNANARFALHLVI